MTLSFEGAEGYGAEATGGRGGQVIVVTSSADSGEGSLRWAIEEFSGPRTIVFEVNNINLTSNINLRDGDVTIAGQTAGGVQVSGATINIQDSNVIMRGMMFRPGDGTDSDVPYSSRDALKLIGGSQPISDIVIDHNSFEWAMDENVEIWKDVSNVTFSNNIVAQALDRLDYPEQQHSLGMLIASGGDGTAPHHISIVDNLYAFNHHRNPRVADGDHIEIINNYIYGMGQQYRAIDISDIRGQSAEYINIMSNYLEAGPETDKTYNSGIKIDTKYNYVSGNVHFDRYGNQLDEEYHGDGAAYVRDSVDFSSGIDIMDAYDVKAYVLANAGANPTNPDSVDQRIIDLILAGQGGLVTSVADAGGYANTPYTPPADTDRDGMPDWFEDRFGFDKVRFDANGDSDGDGYTNLEEYINGIYTGFDLGGSTGGPVSPSDPGSEPAPTEPAPTEPEPTQPAPTEPAPVQSGRAMLFDATTDQAVATLESGATLSDTNVGNADLTIAYQADVPGVASVTLDFNDGQWVRTENSSPYALFGDSNGNYFTSKIGALFPEAGEYSFQVTLHSERGGNGEVLGVETVSFFVGEQASEGTVSSPVQEPAVDTVDAPTTSEPAGFEKHINVGGGEYVASDGTVFAADPGIDGGSYVTRQRRDSVTGTDDDALYQSYGFGEFSYDIEVPEDGTYEVTLYLSEPWAWSDGKRIFDVALEGSVPSAFDDIDIYAFSDGKWDAITLRATVEVTDGVLDIDFDPSVNNGIVSGISVEELL